MKSEREIVRDCAKRNCKSIVTAVRRDLQAMRDFLQASEDSGLDSTWDEICVQAQGEELLLWEDIYIPGILQFVQNYVMKLDDYAKSAIWYQTDHGWDYAYDPDDKGEQKRILNCCSPEEDIEDHLLGQALELAESWPDPRIRAYLDLPRGETDTGTW